MNAVYQDYRQFIDAKTQLEGNHGFSPVWIPDFLFDFQKSLVEHAVVKGRSALFADCGLGKTPMQLVQAENIVRKTGGNVLILTPLAVSAQTEREADKFGITAKVSRDGTIHPGITITNYERLHYFDPSSFAEVICDESAILKGFDGATRHAITGFMRKRMYRLLCSATPAPNDFIELGTSSEALGYLGHVDMLGKFFKNDQNNIAQNRMRGVAAKWRFRGHAETPFWRWVCSWARAIRRPSDLGFADDRFILPELVENEHIVEARTAAIGSLFSMPAVGLREEREERVRTIPERCEKAAELVNHTNDYAIVWCHRNEEGDLLEHLIPDAVQVSGRDSDDRKEQKLLDFSTGNARVLVIKPKIGAWGLNFQHCNHVVTFVSHSYEQHYQQVRRCWRFGQQRPVTVDVISSEGESNVLRNLQRKEEQAERMFDNLVREMNQSISIDRTAQYTTREVLPSWL